MGMLGQAELLIRASTATRIHPPALNNSGSATTGAQRPNPAPPVQGERRAQRRAGRGLLCTPRCRHTLAGGVERHSCQRGAGSTPGGAGRTPACPSG